MQAYKRVIKNSVLHQHENILLFIYGSFYVTKLREATEMNMYDTSIRLSVICSYRELVVIVILLLRFWTTKNN